jgi:alanine racemase
MHHMTHFANADQVNQDPTVGSQLDIFNQTKQRLDGSTSSANSACNSLAPECARELGPSWDDAVRRIPNRSAMQILSMLA